MKALGLVVSDKKIFENCILKTYYLTSWPTYVTNQNHLNNFGRSPPRDHSCWFGQIPISCSKETKEDTRVVHHDKMRLCKDRITPSWARHFQANVKHWESEKDLEKKPRYCFCRKGDNGEFMVQCDKCYEWFHGLCIGQEKRAEARKREYVCGLCK